MSLLARVALFALPPAVIVCSGLSLAQPAPVGTPVPSGWLAKDSGNELNRFKARVAGGHCVATVSYRTGEGRTGEARVVFQAEQKGGYTRCTAGNWTDLSGWNTTGRIGDMIAYKGKFYWPQS